ncbi:MAG: hypothetical protein R2810_04915 [Flavobacteriales bacterium]
MPEVISTGLTDTDIEEFAVGNGNLFAIITYSDGLFVSADNGDTWTLSVCEDFENVTVNGTRSTARAPMEPPAACIVRWTMAAPGRTS